MEVVKVKQGLLQGVPMDGYTVFWGVPYAMPPQGKLRWRPPQEPEPWDGVYSATKYPNRSVQLKSPSPFYNKEFYDIPELETTLSEDSLYLNIWAPQGGERLPVALWIHGGAFLGGYGHEKEFDGEAYCRKGVILVTVNYRVGAFGFLAHPWLSREDAALGGPGVSGNYGILDQIAAIKWVRENIASFGGDPERITVFGQSAGGISTQTLASSPLTEGMLYGAIIQSGLGLDCDRPLAEAEKIGEVFADLAGVCSLEEMRGLSKEKVLETAMASELRKMGGQKLVFGPNIDGLLLTESCESAMEKGHIHPIFYMVGATKQDIGTDPRDLAQGHLGVVYDSCIRWGKCAVENGREPAWVYYFTRQLPGDGEGAFHSSELWYMFGTQKRCWRPFTDADKQLSEMMVSYWTSFMKTGDPNGKDLPQWMPFRREEDVQILDVLENG